MSMEKSDSTDNPFNEYASRYLILLCDSSSLCRLANDENVSASIFSNKLFRRLRICSEYKSEKISDSNLVSLLADRSSRTSRMRPLNVLLLIDVDVS